MIKKVTAILKKDFLIQTSYKFFFLFNLFEVLATILSYFFIDKMFGRRLTVYLEEFGINYFSYVLVSLAFFGYIGTGLGSFANRIRQEQMQGTFEALVATPTRIEIILLGMALWNIIIASIDLLIYIILGLFLFHIDFNSINLISAFVVLLLTVSSFGSLGMLSAGFTVVLKQGNPVSWVINTLEGLLGGVYFPVTVLPVFLQYLAKMLPITHAIRAIQLAVYRNATLAELKNECLFLLLFSVILIPASLKSFSYALRKARKQGSLAQY